MRKFMLIVRADLERMRNIPEDKRFADWPDMRKWVNDLARSGIHLSGAPLAVKGAYVSTNDVLHDGPFIESNECIIGYDLVSVENMEHAVSIAQSCPMVMRGLVVREVRPILFPESFDGDL